MLPMERDTGLFRRDEADLSMRDFSLEVHASSYANLLMASSFEARRETCRGVWPGDRSGDVQGRKSTGIKTESVGQTIDTVDMQDVVVTLQPVSIGWRVMARVSGKS